MLFSKCGLKLPPAMKNHVIMGCLKRGKLNAFENISSKLNCYLHIVRHDQMS